MVKGFFSFAGRKIAGAVCGVGAAKLSTADSSAGGREEAGGHAQTLGIGGNGEEGVGGGVEKDIVNEFTVVEGHGGDGLRRHRSFALAGVTRTSPIFTSISGSLELSTSPESVLVTISKSPFLPFSVFSTIQFTLGTFFGTRP